MTDRIWSQQELLEHAMRLGIAKDQIGDEPIPQGVKYIKGPEPLTEEEIDKITEGLKLR